jgi:hypothetical protein
MQVIAGNCILQTIHYQLVSWKAQNLLKICSEFFFNFVEYFFKFLEFVFKFLESVFNFLKIASLPIRKCMV